MKEWSWKKFGTQLSHRSCPIWCAKCDHPVDTERWIRKISEEIVIDKGFFALHADERSYLLYDIQLWLYTNAYPDTTEEDYLSAYKKIIALDGEFSTGGYASDFVTDWH